MTPQEKDRFCLGRFYEGVEATKKAVRSKLAHIDRLDADLYGIICERIEALIITPPDKETE